MEFKDLIMLVVISALKPLFLDMTLQADNASRDLFTSPTTLELGSVPNSTKPIDAV